MRLSLLGLLLFALCAGAADIITMFSKQEMATCQRFRTPNIVNANGMIHVIARCCGPNLCSGKSQPQRFVNRGFDDVRDCRVVIKSSSDEGLTWDPIQFLTTEVGTANGAGLYDHIRDRIVVQYQYIPGGNTDPTVNTTYYQTMSTDNGATWSSPVDITGLIGACNPNINDMMTQSAGNKVCTGDGRLVWAGHDHSGNICLWYSDDGGETYATTDLMPGNEVSVTQLYPFHETNLYMNGRGQQFSWFPHRADYRSDNDGSTWTAPSESALLDDDGEGCERSLISNETLLYSAEPQGPNRSNMVISCSRDGGQTWPSSRNVNGNSPGGYSDLTIVSGGKILMVWEDNNSGNMYSTQIGEGWC